MGFSFRRSFGTKLARLNLSKSGVTLSTGIKGVRGVVYPNGKFRVYLSKTIFGFLFRYIKTIGGKK